DLDGSDRGPQSNFEVRLDLQQEGPIVSGTFQTGTRIANWIVLSGPIEGSVSGDIFKFKDARGTVSGALTVSGDEVVGPLSGPFGARRLSLRREISSSPASQPTR